MPGRVQFTLDERRRLGENAILASLRDHDAQLYEKALAVTSLGLTHSAWYARSSFTDAETLELARCLARYEQPGPTSGRRSATANPDGRCSIRAESASDIDPRLLKRFALFRESGPDPDGQLTEYETKALDALSLHHKGYVRGRAVKVVVSTSTTLFVLPGRDGVLIAQRGPAARRYAASGAPTETVLRGKPVGRYGALLFGLSPDGVEHNRWLS
jgi:hypothetical protein